jgi:lysozyme family protein
MSDFQAAFNYMIAYEGDKFVDSTLDKGGATKFGISAKFISHLKDNDKLPLLNLVSHPDFIVIPEFKKNVFIDDAYTAIYFYIKNLTREQAQWIYHEYFWLTIYNDIYYQDIANFIFDMTVHHGAKNAAIIAQRGLRCLGYTSCKEDAILGKSTLSGINYMGDGGTFSDRPPLLKIMHSERAGFVRCIVAAHPDQKVFLNGWLKRAYGEKL